MRANIPDLKQWLAKFQPELQDDIDNGARIDCTRKPGFYVRQYKTWRQATYGDWMLVNIDDGEVAEAEEYLTKVSEEGEIKDKAEFIYHATNCDNGLALECLWPHGEHYCECDTPEFADIEEVIALHENQPEEFHNLYQQITVDSYEEFCKWVEKTDAQYVADTLEYTWATDDRVVFLTRKSGERYQDRHPRPDSRIYADYVWHNPDLYNAIALLAALDLEKSTLVFDEDRLDQLDY
ncbi:hypothetical protein [uncultured Actinomyces sp.]|uniref:hypothetical protein n=1 Tax=uncultured Actinomyces sp. TaxID=249061 RepID=UPI00261B36A2|nr:hypothetical protein [uncultured Actinomyces sp.]